MQRKNGESYLALRDSYKARLFDLMADVSQKRIAADGEVAQSTVSSWRGREKSLPDVVTGAMIAKSNGLTVEEMVFGERPQFRHRTREICEIVELLESIAGDRDLVVELRGLVRRHIADHGQEETACTENAKNA